MAELKIAVLTSSYPRFPGDGTAPFIMAFCEGLSALGHDVRVFAPYDPEVIPDENNKVHVNWFKYIWPDKWNVIGHARSLRADVRLRPIAYILLPFYILCAALSLIRNINLQRADLIHVHWILPNGLAAMFASILKGIPYVVSLHGSDMYLARRNKLFRSISRMIFNHAGGVTACSPELLQAALEMGAPERSILLPYGVDTHKFNPEQSNPQIRGSLNSNHDEVLILSLGRLVYKKGFNILIDSIPTVVKAEPKVKVIIGGDGPLKVELADQIELLEMDRYIHLAGTIPWDEIPEYLASGDIFVLPSIRDKYGNIDGLPNVLLEAMSSGKPVIASDIPGVKNVLEDGHTGLLVPSGDSTELSRAIIALVENPSLRKKLGDGARISIQEHFTWQETVKKLARFFNLIIENGNYGKI
jgi:glycosyltransferase involved in cell wall biosynthesis